jgi:hypothetical protein
MSHHAADGICSEDWPDLTDRPGRLGQKLCEGLDTGVRILGELHFSSFSSFSRQIE